MTLLVALITASQLALLVLVLTKDPAAAGLAAGVLVSWFATLRLILNERGP